MRHLVGFVCVLAALAASPLSASAQDVEADASSEPNLQEPAPSAEPAPEGPALELKLGANGVDVVPSAPRSGDGYIVVSEEMELRARVPKARGWLIATSVVTAIGVPLLALGLTYDRRQQPSEGFDLDFTGVGMAFAGGLILIAGVVGMAASGAVLGSSKQELRELQEAHYGRPRRVQWDLARSRLVF